MQSSQPMTPPSQLSTFSHEGFARISRRTTQLQNGTRVAKAGDIPKRLWAWAQQESHGTCQAVDLAWYS
jgi:hypothetical protein